MKRYRWNETFASPLEKGTAPLCTGASLQQQESALQPLSQTQIITTGPTESYLVTKSVSRAAPHQVLLTPNQPGNRGDCYLTSWSAPGRGRAAKSNRAAEVVVLVLVLVSQFGLPPAAQINSCCHLGFFLMIPRFSRDKHGGTLTGTWRGLVTRGSASGGSFRSVGKHLLSTIPMKLFSINILG